MKKLFFSLLALALVGCNFHEVDPGQMYRSAQLNETELTEAIENLGIKTVINLRGANPGNDWYDTEKAVTSKYGIKQIDIAMSASRLPHREDLRTLLDAFAHAERPILVHCKAGADRTGEAMAIYQMLYMGKSREEALKMLTPKYRHIEQFKPAKKYFIRDVWQGEKWARDEYQPCRGGYKYYDVNDPACTGATSVRAAMTEDDDT